MYGINKVDNLYFLNIDFGENGVPTVNRTQLVIENPVSDIDEGADQDEEEEDEDEDNEVLDDIADFDEDEENNDNEGNVFVDDDEYSDYFEDCEELIFETTSYTDNGDWSYETKIRIFMLRYLVESHGKLFMVKRQLQCDQDKKKFTRKVEVFEGDINGGAWLPLVAGLGGQALFISNSLIKFGPACGEIEEDTVYFMDTGDIFNIRSQTNTAIWWDYDYDYDMLVRGVVNGPK